MIAFLLPCVLALTPELQDSLPDSLGLDSSGVFAPPEVLEDVADATGGTELLDELVWRSEHPLDLNRASTTSLLAIPGVSAEDAAAIIRHRATAGRFHSVTQLQSIDGGSIRLFRTVSPYVVVRAQGSRPRVLTLRSRLLYRRQTGRTETEGPAGTSIRVGLRPVEWLELGGFFEKDAGETLRESFSGGYGLVRPPSGGWEIVLGDFVLQAGNGLVLWNGGMNGRSGMAVNTPGKAGGAILPHRAGESNRFFRGAAVTADCFALGGRWCASGFASRRFLIARFDGGGNATTIVEPGGVIAPGPSTGGIRLDAFGARMEYAAEERVFVGLTVIRAAYDHPMLHEDPLRFSGREFTAWGCDLRFHTDRATIFGEISWTRAGGSARTHAMGDAVGNAVSNACLVGTRLVLGPALSCLFLYRSYDPEYDNLFAAGFGDNGTTRNEQGAYAGIFFAPHPNFALRGYVDFYRHPAPGALAPCALRGGEYHLNAEIRLTRAATLRARFNRRIAETRVPGVDPLGRTIDRLSSEGKTRIQWGMDFSPGGGWELQNRFEWVRSASAGGPVSGGVGISQLVRGRIRSLCRFEGRATLFSADLYASRISMIENDLPGVFGSQSLFGNGVRWYLLFVFDPLPWCSLTLKVSATEKDAEINADGRPVEIPSGEDLRAGLELELRW
jgi:hypothetical protein